MKKLLDLRSSTLWLIAVLTTGIAYVSYLALRFETIRLGYDVAQARVEHKRLTEMHRLIALEVSSLRERQRVSAIAERSLQMGSPDVARVVVVDSASTSRALVGGRGAARDEARRTR
jgi:cell division protein FtsL